MIQDVIPATIRSVPVSVIGQDIDRGLIRSLAPADGRFAGDKVLVEINGKRMYSCQPCPLVAESPWEVIRNDDIGLELKHPSSDHTLKLNWADMLPGPQSEPAVFVTNDKWFSCKIIYVILQFVAYQASSVDAHKIFLPRYEMDGLEEALSDDMVRHATLDRITREISRLKPTGFGWNTTARFALRAGVSKPLIDGFRIQNPSSVYGASDTDILKIIQEMRWLRSYRQQSDIQISDATYDKPADAA